MNWDKEQKYLIRSIRTAFYFVVVLWVVHLINILLDGQLALLGIHPRTMDELWNILTAPLVHGDIQHLLSNSIPLFLLMIMMFYFYRSVAMVSFVIIYILTGLSVWLFARDVYHIGASGVVYGLVAFIFWSGIFRRSSRSIVLALAVLVLYSGYFAGILPNQEGVSWESHLFGGLSGIAVAFLFKNELEKSEIESPPSYELNDEENEEYFFERDVFERSKYDRESDRTPPDRYL